MHAEKRHMVRRTHQAHTCCTTIVLQSTLGQTWNGFATFEYPLAHNLYCSSQIPNPQPLKYTLSLFKQPPPPPSPSTHTITAGTASCRYNPPPSPPKFSLFNYPPLPLNPHIYCRYCELQIPLPPTQPPKHTQPIFKHPDGAACVGTLLVLARTVYMHRTLPCTYNW